MVWYLEITNSDYTALQWAALLLMLLTSNCVACWGVQQSTDSPEGDV
jgi:hypothetical protein